jgi:uncharacterized protein YcfJ
MSLPLTRQLLPVAHHLLLRCLWKEVIEMRKKKVMTPLEGSAWALVPEQHRRPARGAAVGAVVGATIGSMIGGPLGAVIGASLLAGVGAAATS